MSLNKEKCEGLNCKEHYGEDHFPPKQDTTDWEERFDELCDTLGIKEFLDMEFDRKLKAFIKEERQKAQQEMIEKVKESIGYGSFGFSNEKGDICLKLKDLESLLSNQ